MMRRNRFLSELTHSLKRRAFCFTPVGSAIAPIGLEQEAPHLHKV